MPPLHCATWQECCARLQLCWEDKTPPLCCWEIQSVWVWRGCGGTSYLLLIPGQLKYLLQSNRGGGGAVSHLCVRQTQYYMPIFAIIRICCNGFFVWVMADEINIICLFAARSWQKFKVRDTKKIKVNWVSPLRTSILRRYISLDGEISRWKLARAPWWQTMCLPIVVLCAFICWMVCICVCPPMFVGGCECGAGKFIKT